MSDDDRSRDEEAPAFVHPDYVRTAVAAIQAAHAFGANSVEFYDEVRIGLRAALPLALAELREQLADANERAKQAEASVRLLREGAALIDQQRDDTDAVTRAEFEAAMDEMRAARDEASARAERAEAKLAHSESVVEAFHAEADRLSDLLDAARDDVQRYRTGYERLRARIAGLGGPEIEYRFVQPDGTASEFDLHNGPCDCQRQARVGDGPWLAAGGWVSGDAAAPALGSGCTFLLLSREALERQAGQPATAEPNTPDKEPTS